MSPNGILEKLQVTDKEWDLIDDKMAN